jgi:hypothetical protein
MKASTNNCRAALGTGSFVKWYVADLYYDGERRIENVPIKDLNLTEDDSRAIKAQGGCSIVWTDDYGQSIMPVNIGDLFSPFGSELALYAIVAGGTFTERIPMGWYQIVDVPTMRDQTMFFNDRLITVGTTLELKLQDRFSQIQKDQFDVPSAPSQLESVWDEIGILTGLQLTRTIPDAPISRSVVYQEDRMQAVLDLADIIGGVPYATPDGTLAMRTKTWGARVDTLRRGDEGSIVSIDKGMSADQVYNKVVFRGQGEQQDQVLASSEIRIGALRTQNPDGSRSPAHRRPTFRSNQFVTTAAQAKDYTDSELDRVSTLNAIQWPITELWNPLRELGDVLDVVDEHNITRTARITALSRSQAATQKVMVTRG